MPDDRKNYPDPREEDIFAGDRRISRPDSSLPDWEVPDTAYRPIPIVWFTGAMVVQLVALFVIVLAFQHQTGWITISLSSLATGAIGKWTWDRGMSNAGYGWKLATITVMVAQLALACLAAGARL